jgi:hypothetical protein
MFGEVLGHTDRTLQNLLGLLELPLLAVDAGQHPTCLNVPLQVVVAAELELDVTYRLDGLLGKAVTQFVAEAGLLEL